MLRRIVAGVGYVFMAAVFAGVWLTALTAARKGQAFYGVNYKGLDLGTYSTLAALTMVTVILGVLAVQRVVRAVRRWRSTRT
jgi:hypothetical protein